MALTFWSNAVGKSKELIGARKEESELLSESRTSGSSTTNPTPAQSSDSAASDVVDSPNATSPSETTPVAISAASDVKSNSVVTSAAVPHVEKRFSWRSLVRPKGAQDRKPSLPPPREEAAKEATARQEYVERQILRTRSEKRALKSALVVRELIVGPFAAPSAAPPMRSNVSVAGMSSARKVKAQLLEPKAAKQVIAQLRQLPSSDVPVVVGKTSTGEDVKALPSGPIHAVCLAYTDAEADEKHFAKLDRVEVRSPPFPKSDSKMKERSLDLSDAVDGITSVTATSFEKLKSMLADLNVVSLITVPDLGLGQPADAPGLLSGAVPTAKAVLEGVEQITPQLMALGYATGKSILPSHAGVYPPTDRMSVITYWWGLEVVIPEPSVQYLSNAPSIAHTVVNFLTALSVASGGVRELLPFVRYISQYVDAEFSMIRNQDVGQGVVCAATWIMPAALVPRPWDFPQPPVGSKPAGDDEDASKPAPTSTSPASAPSGTANAGSGAVLTAPPLPNPNHAPVFVAPMATTEPDSESVSGNPEEGVPGVTVTPPTPPPSETLSKAMGAGMAARAVDPSDAADKADENGIAAVGEAGAHEGVVNGAPVV